jgi:AsmA protein
LSFVLADPRPAVEGTIASERLDLTPYAEAARGSATAEGSWVIAPVSLAFADALDANVRVTAGQVLIGATRLVAVDAGVTVKDGAIGVDIAKAQLYGGSLVARVGAGMVGDALVAGADAEISGVPARVALADLAGIDSIDGTAAVSLSVQSRGATWGELARGLAGTGAVSVTRGTLAGLDVTAIAEAMADPLAEPLEAVAGSTAFSRLAATLTMGNGGLSTGDLTMSGSGYSLALSGKGSLISGLVEAKATLAGRFGDIPLNVTGRWRVPLIARQAPAALPDEQAITHDETGAATGG